MNNKMKTVTLTLAAAAMYTMHSMFNVIGWGIKVACLALVVVAFAACTTTKTMQIPTASTWIMTEQANNKQVATTKPISITFDNGKVSGFSGVNRFTGSYTTDNKKSIKFSQMAGTRMMGINAEANAKEKDFLEKLPRIDSYKVTKKQLKLYAGKELLLKFNLDTAAIN